MKKTLKIVSICLLVFLYSCEADKNFTDNSQTNTKNYNLKNISFKELRLNKKAFQKLKETAILKQPSLMGRGVYNEAFDVFIDTTNIIVVENEFNHSITFQIVGKENEKVIENLILNSKPEGGYKAFIAKYDLSSEELLTLLDDEKLLTKKPTTITEVNNYSRMDVGGDGADCINIEIGTRSVCRDANGNIISNNGELGNNCVGMAFEQEYLVLTIDAGCLSGGGGGSSPGSGSGTSPGTGQSGGGGGGSAGGNPGNPENPNTGNPPNDGGNNNTPGQQDPSLTDGNGNPIITTPILTINRTLIKLLNQLNPQQKDWWNTMATETVKSEIIDYLNQNTTDGVIDAEALEFVKEVIDYFNESLTSNWDYIYNNRTHFDINQSEIDDYQTGGFDNTTYIAFNPQTDPWQNIATVIPQNKFVGWGAPNIRRNCMDYAKAQIAKVGYQISNYYDSGQTFQIYTTQNGVNNANLLKGLSYLKYALSNGIPVIVGVDDAPGHPGNLDNSTDHFIVIVGMGTDSNGKYFQFYDNASGVVSQGTSSLNKLYYNSTTGIISGNSQTDYATNQPLPYTITMIRKSKPL